MTPTETATWERDGETAVNSGEIDGMDAPNWGPADSDFENEIVHPYFTAYYRRGKAEHAASTYYVVKTMSWNQPEPELVWVVEELTWVGALDVNGDITEDDRMYESASALFYYSEESALKFARARADTDESFAFL